jgi:Na+/proline symporter
MNKIRKILGIVWILLGIMAGYYLIISQAIPKFESAKPEDTIPAIIYAFILTPIITFGLAVFGYYAWIGEYQRKP